MSNGPRLRQVLRAPGFRRLLGTRLTSQTADGVLQAGLAAYVLFSPERQTSALKVAAAFAVLLLPYSVLGPFAGVMLDRWSRRHVIVRANFVRAALVGLLAVQVAAGHDGLDLVAVALCVLGVNRFFLAALSAAMPHVVRTDQLVLANAVAPTAGTVAAAVGGTLGLVLRGALGGSDGAAAGIVLAAGAGYLVAALVGSGFAATALGPPPPAEGGPEPVGAAVSRVVGELVEGLRLVARTPRAARALAVIGAHRMLFGALTVLVVLLQRYTFHTDPDAGLAGLALTFVAVGLGVPLGAALTPSGVRRLGTQRWMALLLALAGVALLVLGLPLREWPMAAAGLVVGCAGQGVKVAVDATLQLVVDDEHLGRVYSLYDVVFNVAFVAAAAAAAAMLPPDGRSPALLGGIALAYLLVAGWLLRPVPGGRSPGGRSPGGRSPGGRSPGGRPGEGSPGQPA